MEELYKMRRVLQKQNPAAPHHSWLVVDGSTGVNAVEQARVFHDKFGLTGLIVTKLDRLSRNTVDTLNLINDLSERKVQFKALDIQLDTTTPTGKFAVTVMAAVAELERTRIRERQAEGIAKAKEKGKYKGRASEFHQHIPIVRNFLEMGKGATYIAKQLNISRTTVYKIKKEIDLDGQTAMNI